MIVECAAPCLGYSFQLHQPVTALLADRFPVSLSIALGAVALQAVFGIAAGALAARRQGGILDRVVTGVCSLFAQPAAQAALTTMFAATRPLPPCSYTGPDAMQHLRGMPTLIGRSAEASDPAIAERFWEFAAAETATD